MYSDTKIFLEPSDIMAHQVEKLKEDWYQNFPLFFAHGAAEGKGLPCCVKTFKTHIPCHTYMPHTDT